MHPIVISIALAFAAMGASALIAPARVPALFGVAAIGTDMANEVRAVYGGFGLAIALLLLASSAWPGLERGVLLTVAVALLGMASGRAAAWAIDRTLGWLPALLGAIELTAGGLLLYVFATRGAA